MSRMNRKIELLIPAGSMEGLKTAIHYGADAVYMGGEAFGLRANAKNFTIEKMKEAVAYAHERGVKVYVTANILAHNEDLLPMREYFLELKGVGMDAVLVADPGAFMLAREIMPEVELHISTQANNTNYETFLFWWKLGAKRVVCARELSLKEIRKQMAETEKQIKQLEKQERVQKAKLAKQIDAIYRSGVNPSTLERMLSEDAKKAERMKVYYQHLNQVRIDMINNLKATQENLAKQREAISGQQKNHRDQLSTQKKQQQELQKAQQERQSTLNELNKNLTKDQNKLETLKANENALRQEIQRAEQAARQQEQREREALAQKKQEEEKRTSKPYQPKEYNVGPETGRLY